MTFDKTSGLADDYDIGFVYKHDQCQVMGEPSDSVVVDTIDTIGCIHTLPERLETALNKFSPMINPAECVGVLAKHPAPFIFGVTSVGMKDHAPIMFRNTIAGILRSKGAPEDTLFGVHWHVPESRYNAAYAHVSSPFIMPDGNPLQASTLFVNLAKVAHPVTGEICVTLLEAFDNGLVTDGAPINN